MSEGTETPTVDAMREALEGKQVWLWHYLHADWQWEQSRAWHEDRYVVAVEEVLDILGRGDGIAYYFDTASEFLEPVLRKLGPGRRAELQRAVDAGSIRLVSGQVANARPNQVGDETYIRNLQIGADIFAREFGQHALELFHSVDIAVGHSQMPQILQLAGFKYYRAWRPHGAMNLAGIPHQFWWRGLDGSKILVTRGKYGGMFQRGASPEGFRQDWDSAVRMLYNEFWNDQLIDDRSPSGMLWMVQGSDDSRPFRAHSGDEYFDLNSLVQKWNAEEATPLRWGTPLEFAKAIETHAAGLATVDGVLDACDCAYNAANGGSNGLWARRLSNDERLLTSQTWAAIAALTKSGCSDVDLEGLWKRHLVYQAHAQDFSFVDDLQDLFDMAEGVKLAAEGCTRSALAAIATGAGGGARTNRYVFNEHPWAVEAEVEVVHPFAKAGYQDLTVKDGDGSVLPQQSVRRFAHPRYAGSVNEQTQLVRVQIPALGYTRLTIDEREEIPEDVPAAPVGDGGSEAIDLPGLHLLFENHVLRRVRDLAAGHDYVEKKHAGWPTLCFYELQDQNWIFEGPEVAEHLFEPDAHEWREVGPLRWCHRSRGRLGPYRGWVDVVATAGRRELTVRVHLEGHWDEAPMTGYVALSADAGPGAITVDVPFGVEGRDPDNESYDSAAHNSPTGLGSTELMERLRPGFFWGRSWAACSAQDHGLTLISGERGKFWLKNQFGVGHVLLRAIKRTEGTWEARTGDHMTGTGVHDFSYCLQFHDGDWRATDPQRRSMELSRPPLVVRPDRVTEVQNPPAAHSFLGISGPAVLSSFYSKGDAHVLRMYESTGKGGKVSIRLDWPPTSVQAVDLRDAPLNVPIEVRDSEVELEVAPWQIVTLLLRLPEGQRPA